MTERQARRVAVPWRNAHSVVAHRASQPRVARSTLQVGRSPVALHDSEGPTVAQDPGLALAEARMGGIADRPLYIRRTVEGDVVVVRVVAEPDPATWGQRALHHGPERLPPRLGDMGDPEAEDDRGPTPGRLPGEQVHHDVLDPIRPVPGGVDGEHLSRGVDHGDPIGVAQDDLGEGPGTRGQLQHLTLRTEAIQGVHQLSGVAMPARCERGPEVEAVGPVPPVVVLGRPRPVVGHLLLQKRVKVFAVYPRHGRDVNGGWTS